MQTNTGNQYSLKTRKRNLHTIVYIKSFGIFSTAFALAFLISKIRPFQSIENNFQLLAAFTICSSIIYLVLYAWQLPKAEAKIAQNQQPICNTMALALVMPVLLGFMIAPVFLRFEIKEVIGAMIGALAIGGVACLYGATTKKDLAEPVGFIAVCGIAVLIASLINIFVLKNDFISIGMSAFFIVCYAAVLAYESSKINQQADQLLPALETDFTNCKSINIANSLVGITLELLKIKESADRISAREQRCAQ